MLKTMGYDPGLKGTQLTTEAVLRLAADPHAGFESVYRGLAEARGTSWRTVERSMRYALRVAEESPTFWEMYSTRLGNWRPSTNERVCRSIARWAVED